MDNQDLAHAPGGLAGGLTHRLTGLWRRRRCRYDDGGQDESMRTMRLQTEAHYADIRVPAARPALATPDAALTLSEEDLERLLAMDACAGRIECRGDLCRFSHVLSFRPDVGAEDSGRIEEDGALRLDRAAAGRCVEEWVREDDGRGLALAMTLLDERDMIIGAVRTPPGMFLVIGDRFIFARGRDPDAWPEVGGPRARLGDWLSCHVSYGRMSSWRVALSTQPWREGRPLFLPGALRFRPEDQVLRELVDGGLLIRRWRVVESGLPPDRLRPLLSF